MRDTWKSAKVGLLVVAAVVASYLVYRAVEERAGGDQGYVVWGLFEDAQGLVPKSRVVIAGISVGYIQDIRLQEGKARVDIYIEQGVPVHDDAWVTKEQASLLGESILVINPGSPDQPQKEDGDRIRVVETTTDTGDILATVSEIADSVRAVTQQLERSFGTDEAGTQMQSALRNLSEALEAINETIRQNQETIARTLENVEETTSVAGPQIVRILDNVESVTRDVQSIVGNNREGLENAGGDVTSAIASINRSAEQLEEVMGDIHEVTGRTARGEGTIGRLTQDETLIDEVEGVVEGVGDIVGGISRLQTIVELRSEYNFLANTFKNYVGLRIQPREDRYYLIQLINDPRGLTEFEQTIIRRSPPSDGDPPVQQETRITRRDAFRFSLMFAKRIHFATFRFGILESTGGVGVDFHFLDDHLELTADMFAFGEQTYPRLRLRLSYEVVQRLWLLGGIDDALNGNSRDFFLGAQLRFNDEDLKSILPFASGVSTGGG